MSTPTVFLSAASVDLREWREVLDAAFRRAGFRVLTQDKSLASAPGNVRQLLVDTIAESDCVIHLAGLGYGSDATDPFPEAPAFQCSWTQFEYYHAHREKKGVIAFVCAPALSKSGFVETGTDPADIERKQRLQVAHRRRVEEGTFEDTPLPNTPADRTCNESVSTVGALLAAVAAAVGTLQKLDRDACAAAQKELSDLATVIARIEAGVGSANDKLDRILSLLRPPVASAPFQLPDAASRYFGRAAMVADLTSRLRKHRRTDVWGGAGMGKTALAAEAVSRIVGQDPAALPTSPFPNGVVFLDLYRHKTLELAWQALANTFDDSLPTDIPARDRAARACAKRRALVILEGAEELGDTLPSFVSVLAPESTLLVLTREEKQTAAGRRLRLDDLLEDADARALLRHLVGATANVSDRILDAIQARLGGHPLALTWAGSQLNDANQPAAHFLRDLEAAPFTKLTEPGGDPDHTLQWMFERSVRFLSNTTRTVLAAVARLSGPFGEEWAQVAGGTESDLQRLVQLSFLRLSSDPSGWQFAHALAAQYARVLPLPSGLLASLGHQAVRNLATADARCVSDGLAPLGIALTHATALLSQPDPERVLHPVAQALIDHDNVQGVVGLRRGRLDYARQALAAHRQWHEGASPELKATPSWQRDLSVSLNRLGDLAVAQGDLAASARYFAQDMAIAERLAASDPANTEWQRDLSVSLNKLGELAVAQGDLAAAAGHFTQCKTIRERLAASDPANAEWQRDLSVSLNKLGELAVAQGDLAAAAGHFTQSKTIAEPLAASDPANVGWQRDLSVSLEKLGNLAVAQGDLAAAAGHFTQSKTIAERLAASDSANVGWQRDLWMSNGKLGDLAASQGNLQKALRDWTTANDITSRLAASDPANAEWQRDLVVSHWRLADLAEKQGLATEAKESWRRAHEVLSAMKARGIMRPTDAPYLEHLAAKVNAG